jgi:hypothetical protein
MSGKRLLYRPLTGTTEAGSVGIARPAKGNVTPAGEKFCEILRQISISNSTKATHDRCLSQGQSCAADRMAAEMNEMPVVSVSVLARILAHRRDEHPIGKRQISNCERIKQARHCQRSLVSPAAP